MSMLQGILEGGGFGITCEMAPPKAADFSECMETAQLIAGVVHGINVTDMQSACLKASSLGLCIMLKEAGLDPILQMTGRDRNRMALMGDILTAGAFGIDTILALTGDHTVIGDCKCAKPVFDLDSVGILKMISKMEEEGTDCGGNELTGAVPAFFKGACVTPVYDPIVMQIAKLKKKVDAGAGFVQTQGIFDIDKLKIFMDEVDKANIDTKIMAGIIPLKAAGMAKYMNGSVPGIEVPDWMIEKLAKAGEEGKEKGIKGLPAKVGIQMAAELVQRIKEEKICNGVHIMAIGAERNVPEILRQAGLVSK